MAVKTVVFLSALMLASSCSTVRDIAQTNQSTLPMPSDVSDLLGYPYLNVGKKLSVEFAETSFSYVTLQDGSNVYSVNLTFMESEKLCLPTALRDWPDIYDAGNAVLGKRNGGEPFLFSRHWGYPNDTVALSEISEFNHSVTKVFRSNFSVDQVKITLPALRCDKASEVGAGQDQEWSYVQTDWIDLTPAPSKIQ